MIAWHRQTGIASVPYSAQARGYFDKLRGDALDAGTARLYDSPANRARGADLARLAARRGVTPTEAMLALFRLAPFPVIPVVGCRTPGHVASSVRALDIALDPGEAEPLLAALGIAAEPGPGAGAPPDTETAPPQTGTDPKGRRA